MYLASLGEPAVVVVTHTQLKVAACKMQWYDWQLCVHHPMQVSDDLTLVQYL